MTATQYPNGAILMDVDSEVQEVLAMAGCIGELQETPGRNWIAHGWQTPDAFYFATHDYGHVLPIDNGYTLAILPKSHFTEAAACELVRDWSVNHAPDAQFEDCPQVAWN